ncbi:MAG: RNA polymerase sigma factor [Gammaproteobacteria bacterium]
MKILDRLCTARSLRHRIAASRDRLFRVALAWSGDAMVADDLVQETLETALDKAQQLRDPERLYAWMYSIMNNCWRHYLRRQRPECELDEMQFASDSDPEQLSDQHAAILQVRAAIARLPVGQREVLTLVDLEGFAYQEVADILEIPIGTVMSRLSRARGFLQVALQSLRQEPGAAAARLRRVQ